MHTTRGKWLGSSSIPRVSSRGTTEIWNSDSSTKSKFSSHHSGATVQSKNWSEISYDSITWAPVLHGTGLILLHHTKPGTAAPRPLPGLNSSTAQPIGLLQGEVPRAGQPVHSYRIWRASWDIFLKQLWPTKWLREQQSGRSLLQVGVTVSQDWDKNERYKARRTEKGSPSFTW